MSGEELLLGEFVIPAVELEQLIEEAELSDCADLAAAYFAVDAGDMLRAETLLRNEVVEHTEKTVYSVVPPPALPDEYFLRQRPEMTAAVERYFSPTEIPAANVAAVAENKDVAVEVKSGLVIRPEQEVVFSPRIEERLAEKICSRVEARLKARIMGVSGRFC